MAVEDWSSTASENGTVLGVNIAENCPAANMNNALRQAMADIAAGINFSILGPVLSANSLSAARSALGVSGGSTSANNFSNLTNAANKVPYMTGSDAWDTFTATSFFRSLGAGGDAAAVRTLLGAIGGATATLGSNSISISLPLGTGDTLLIKGGTGTIGGNSTGTLSFGSTFGAAPVVIVSGGPTDTASEGSIHTTGSAGTSSISIINTSGFSSTYNWLALGKA